MKKILALLLISIYFFSCEKNEVEENPEDFKLISSVWKANAMSGDKIQLSFISEDEVEIIGYYKVKPSLNLKIIKNYSLQIDKYDFIYITIHDIWDTRFSKKYDCNLQIHKDRKKMISLDSGNAFYFEPGYGIGINKGTVFLR